MSYLLISVGSFTVGTAWGLLIFLGVHRRMLQRIANKGQLVLVATELATRRQTYDLQRDTLPREGAGPPAKIRNMMPPRRNYY